MLILYVCRKSANPKHKHLQKFILKKNHDIRKLLSLCQYMPKWNKQTVRFFHMTLSVLTWINNKKKLIYPCAIRWLTRNYNDSFVWCAKSKGNCRHYLLFCFILHVLLWLVHVIYFILFTFFLFSLIDASRALFTLHIIFILWYWTSLKGSWIQSNI